MNLKIFIKLESRYPIMDIVKTSSTVIVSSINLYLYCGILIYMRGRVSKGDAKRERSKNEEKKRSQKIQNREIKKIMKHNKN